MSIPLLTFYIFSGVLVASAAMVIAAKTPVHSVLFLILSFFNAAGLFVLMGAEFLAMILVIVYVGAVAVLFLFVVMMFDTHFGKLGSAVSKYKAVGLSIGCILLAELVFLYINWQLSPFSGEILSNPVPSHRTNTHAIGDILYTNYFLLFQISGLILLVAIVGAISLTLKDRIVGLRRQNISAQLERDGKKSVKLVQVETGKGVSL